MLGVAPGAVVIVGDIDARQMIELFIAPIHFRSALTRQPVDAAYVSELAGRVIAVPTIRPRFQVTETPEVARALDRAAQRWPGESRSKLLIRPLEPGRCASSRCHRDPAGRSRGLLVHTLTPVEVPVGGVGGAAGRTTRGSRSRCDVDATRSVDTRSRHAA